MATIAVYKTLSPDQYAFGSIKKDNGTYILKPEAKLFVQTPAVVLKDDTILKDAQSRNLVKVSVPCKFAKWLSEVEAHVVQYAIANKTSLFKHELPDSFISESFKPSVMDGEWILSAHPDLSVFDHEKKLVASTLPVKESKVSLIVYLHSVRFSKHTFHVRWTVRSVRTQRPPEYCFIDGDDDDCTLTDELTEEEVAEEFVNTEAEAEPVKAEISAVDLEIANDIADQVSEEIPTADTAIPMAPEDATDVLDTDAAETEKEEDKVEAEEAAVKEAEEAAVKEAEEEAVKEAVEVVEETDIEEVVDKVVVEDAQEAEKVVETVDAVETEATETDNAVAADGEEASEAAATDAVETVDVVVAEEASEEAQDQEPTEESPKETEETFEEEEDVVTEDDPDVSQSQEATESAPKQDVEEITDIAQGDSPVSVVILVRDE